MVLGVVVALVGIRIDEDWRHQILVLEICELVPFALFWTLQTVEHWEGGVPTGADREPAPSVASQRWQHLVGEAHERLV